MSYRTSSSVAALVAAGLLCLGFSQAEAATSGTITPTQPVQTHDAGPFPVSNPAAQGFDGPVCNAQAPCDSYLLTVDLPSGYVAAHPNAAVKVSLSWTDTSGQGAADYDLYVFKGEIGDTTGGAADYAGGGGDNPEVATVFPLADGAFKYTIKSVPYTSTGEVVHLKMELFPGTAGTPTDPNFGGADPTVPGAPRYQTFFAPKGTSAEEGSQGEYNIGYNPKTGRILNMNIGPIWRITPAEVLPGGAVPYKNSGLPESCPEFWEDVSNPSTDTGLDPILITDPVSGRTFATNSTAGGAAIYTDNDGGDPPANDQPNVAWLQSAQPPNGGADHETFGVGPLPASLANLANPTNQGQWVVYCSQDLVAPSMCQRSLTLGTSYDNPTPGTGLNCSGLHGHARIGPDGTAYLPVKNCGGVAGGSLSLDSSVSPWTEFTVEKTAADTNGPAFKSNPQGDGADPSIGIDTDGTVYYCYVNNEANGTEGHVHVAVGQRNGTAIKWLRDSDVGKSHGVVNAAHTEAVAGSSGRAACGFIGTNVPGNYQAGDFPGVWYPFIATTYDQGKTWVTVNAAPNDPDQFATGVWQQGGGGQNGDRNLLDFNEMTMDEKGRVLYGHSDGCVSPACIADRVGNDKTAFMRVTRQIGGKGLVASKDVAEPAAPKRACLLDKAWKNANHPDFKESQRDNHAAYLRWRAPDNNGAVIDHYEIYRSTVKGFTPDSSTLLFTTTDAKTSYTDETADPLVPDYYYLVKTVNANGTSAASNELLLKVGDVNVGGGSPCVLPGVLVADDSASDSTTNGVPGQELLAIYGAELYAPTKPDKLYFTMKVDTLSPAAPANTVYYVNFTVGGVQYFLSYDTSETGPTAQPYSYGWLDTTQTPQRLTSCTTGTDLDAESGTSPDGTIVLVISKSKINACAAALGKSGNLSNTKVLTSVYGEIRALIGTGPTGGLVTTVDDSAPAPYTQVGNLFCAPNTAPIVDSLSADPQEGAAPLDVSFTATGHDPDTATLGDTVASYTFKFGDGSPDVTQASPTVSHTYNNAGSYVASVKVTDSRGLVSVNDAHTQIVATGTPKVVLPENNRLGGALPWLSLLLLGGAGAWRRSRRY